MNDLKNEIAENDKLRVSLEGGCVEISGDVASSKNIEAILKSVRGYDFSGHKDDLDDHSFGLVEFDDGWVFWEISQCQKEKTQQCRCTSRKNLSICYDYEFFQEDAGS